MKKSGYLALIAIIYALANPFSVYSQENNPIVIEL